MKPAAPDPLPWFKAWVKLFVARFPRSDWPVAPHPFWDELKAAFVRHGVAEDEAHSACGDLFENPPRFPADFPPRLLEGAKKFRTLKRGLDEPKTADNHSEWNLKCQSHWNSLSDVERESWRNLVRRRMPMLAALPSGVILIAKLAPGWAYEPELIPREAAPPPPPEKRVHRPFS